MLRTLAVVGVAYAAADGEWENAYKKGFVRQPRNGITPVAEITSQDRQNTPDSIDWSAKGATTPVKNQGRCGSCWAFSATEGVESQAFMTTGTLPSPLATQQLVACDPSDGGCNGGDLPTAFDYLKGAGGQDTDAHYPDTSHVNGHTGSCVWDGSETVKVTGYKYAVEPCMSGDCKGQDEEALAAALAKYGPISICVNAANWGAAYHGGIYPQDCAGGYYDLDHCVQLVGYDKTAATPFWKVRNSWGPGWGEGGHVWLPMGENSCGVASEAVIPLVQPGDGPAPAPRTWQCQKHSYGEGAQTTLAKSYNIKDCEAECEKSDGCVGVNWNWWTYVCQGLTEAPSSSSSNYMWQSCVLPGATTVV